LYLPKEVGDGANKVFTVPAFYARGAQKGKVGNKGGEKLSMNMDRFEYMCEFVDVASICPKTCSSCELFA
jgi:hypothetical protein